MSAEGDESVLVGLTESRVTRHESRGLMRQAILSEPRRIELVTRPIPSPEAGEVLIAVRAALTCGTDLKTYRRGHPKVPFGPFGHECAGDVVAVGAGVRNIREGDSVVPMPTASCGRCAACRRGRENLCERLFDDIVLGAYADFLLVSSKVAETHLLRKPSGLSYIESAFMEPLACVVHAWNRLSPAPVEQVAVIGLGAIGMLHIAMARARGARVIGVGRRTERLALALEVGAHAVVDTEREHVGESLRALTGGVGPDVVIECTGSPTIWMEAPRWAATGGRVVLFAGLMDGTHVAFDATRLHYDEVDVINAFHFRPPDVEQAHHLLETGAIAARPLISGVRALDEVASVFASLDRGNGVKYAILPQAVAWA